MTTIKSAIWSLIIIGLFSCSNGNEKMARYAAPMIVAESADLEADQVNKQTNEGIERKVIKRGEIRFETKNLEETTVFITESVKNLRGYISSDNTYSSADRINSRLEIRIPSDSFDVLLSRISENVKKIEYKNVQLQDVTEEYIDVESRIKTKKELENRYMELLSVAKTVQEILSIEKELGTLRSDIESIEGRLKYLKDQVSLSTLTVDYYQMTSTTLNFSSKIGNAFVTGWKFLLSFIIGLVNMWPFILIIGLVVILIIRFGRKKKTIKNAS
jgi:hypothetical protein